MSDGPMSGVRVLDVSTILAGRCQPHAVPAAGEQDDVELLLQQPDLLADGGLADPAPDGRRTQRSGLDGGQEIACSLHPHRPTIEGEPFTREVESCLPSAPTAER